MRIMLALGLWIISIPLTWSGPLQVKVAFQWEYKNFGAAVEMYEVRGQTHLWETKSVSSLDAAPVGKRIVPSELVFTQGQAKRFALVVHNTSGKPMYFFAAPHVVHPAEHSLGFKFKCLCINHVYKINPTDTWYRIVEFRLSKGFVGEELVVTHSVIGIDKERAESFENESLRPES